MTYIDTMYHLTVKNQSFHEMCIVCMGYDMRLIKSANSLLVTVEWLFYVRFSYSYHTLKLVTCKYILRLLVSISLLNRAMTLEKF